MLEPTQSAASDGAPETGVQADWLVHLYQLARREARRQLRGKPLLRKEQPTDIALSVAREILEHGDELRPLTGAADDALVRKVLLHKIVEKYRYYRAQKRDMRKEAAEPLPLGDPETAAETAPEDPGSGPPTIAGHREVLARVRDRLVLLSDRERTVLRLKMGGRSHEDIGTALGITAQRSARILADARKKLAVP